MTKNEFREKLEENDLIVTFIKRTTGEKRTMRCSANIPEELKKIALLEVGETTNGPVVVYSVDDKGMRSFYLDSVIEIKDTGCKFGLLQE